VFIRSQRYSETSAKLDRSSASGSVPLADQAVAVQNEVCRGLYNAFRFALPHPSWPCRSGSPRL